MTTGSLIKSYASLKGIKMNSMTPEYSNTGVSFRKTN